MFATSDTRLSASAVPMTRRDTGIDSLQFDLWAQAIGLDEIPSFEIAVADLPGDRLGTARLSPQAGNTVGKITLDVDANGVGWFVDPTPWEDSEFGSMLTFSASEAAFDSPAAGRYDLLTVLSHEIGHLIGFNYANVGLGLTSENRTAHGGHLDGDSHARDLMNAVLTPSVRKLPSVPDVLVLEQGYALGKESCAANAELEL